MSFLNPKNIPKNLALTLFLALGLVITTQFTSAQILPLFTPDAGGGGSSEENPLQGRIDRDDQAVEREVQELVRLQKEDEKLCKAQGGGYTSPGNPIEQGQLQPSASDRVQNPDGSSPQIYGEPVAGEDDTRNALAAGGVTVNKEDCGGQDYRNVPGGCTSVAGLPQHAIDRSIEINQAIGGGLVLTGGTEGGHQSHAPGSNVVDYRPMESLDNYVTTNTVSSRTNSRGERVYYLNNGDIFTRESDHWHAQLNGTIGQGTQTAYNLKINKLFAFLKNFLISNLSLKTAQAEDFDLSAAVNIGGTEFNLNQINEGDNLTRLSASINSLTPSQISATFAQISSDNTTTILNANLSFETLNNVLANLDSSTLNEVIPGLGAGNLNNIAGLLDSDSVDNILGNLNEGNLTNLLGQVNPDTLNTLFISIGDEDLYEQIFSSIGNDTLEGLMGQLGDGAINNIFSELSRGTLNNLLSGFGMSSLNDIFGQLSGSPLNSVLGLLDGDLAETVFSVLGDGAMANVLQNALPEVIDGVLGELPEDLLNDIATTLSVDGVLDELAPVLGDISAFDDILPSIGIGGGFLSAGLYVPVVEQNGQLMQLTNSTNETTGRIEQLNIQICTHLKAIKRIQQRFEQKMVADASVRRAASTVIEQYRGNLLGEDGIIKKGYQDSNGNTAPLYVINEGVSIAQARDEAKRIVLNNIKNSNNMYKDEIAEALAIDSIGQPFQPTLTEKELKILSSAEKNGFGENSPTTEEPVAQGKNTSILATLKNIPFLGRLANPINKLALLFGVKTSYADTEAPDPEDYTDAEYWTALLKMFQPQNNRYGSYLIANDQLRRSQALAEANVRDEMIAGQGFLPLRNCNKWITDPEDSSIKTCLMWETVTPASIVKDTASQGLGSRLAQYETAREMGDINVGNEPNAGELNNFTPTNDGGGAPGPGMVRANQIPEQIEQISTYTLDNTDWGTGEGDDPNGGNGEGGGEEGGNNWTSFILQLDLMMSESDSPSSGDLNLLELLLQLLATAYQNAKPLVHFNDKAKEGGQYLLYWASPNATTCKAGNDWASGLEIIKRTGDDLAKQDNLLVTASTTANIYKLDCVNAKGTTQETINL